MFRVRIGAFAIGLALVAAACSGATSTSAPAVSSTNDTVSMQQVPGVGDVYTDANGMALYTPVQEASGKISCVGACTSVWIPLAAPTNGAPTEAPSVHGDVGVITRPDGTSQVTLNGAPLYRFYQDTAAGTANGNGISDTFDGTNFTWHVAAPKGTAAANTTSGSNGYGSGSYGSGSYGSGSYGGGYGG